MKNDMTNGRTGRALLIFSLPMILGNLFQQFYNMADTMIVGRCLGEDALAAVGASYALTTVFVMIAIGGGIGASVLVSQYFGAKNYSSMKTAVNTSLFSFLLLSIVLALLGYILSPQILQWLKTPDNIAADANLYLKIYFFGLPFLFMYNVLTSTFNALGESKIPLYLLGFSSVLNIFLDLYFIRELKMGVDGAAIATVIAQGLSAVLSFGILMKKLKQYEVQEGQRVRRYDVSMLVRGTKIAIPSVIQQSIVSIGMLLVQSVVNSFGSSALAGYSAGNRVESICIIPMIAMGNAVSTFTAQNLGARKPERVRKGYRAAYGIVLVFAALIIIVIRLFHNEIISAFLESDTGEAIRVGNAYMGFLCFFFAVIGFKAITDGVLRGAGDCNVYMAANLVNLTFRVTFANILAPIIGIQAVWYAIPIGWAINYIISFARYLSGKWERMNLIGTP